MAEFQALMQEAARICRAHVECGTCPLREIADMYNTYCPIQIMRKWDAAKIEAAVMDWAAEHPEPRYPSWIEWQGANFQMAERAICAAYFMDAGDAGCYVNGRCDKCRERPIPADIAERLGIKPIGGKNDG